jgi:PPOX class probable F420-dependent enzyme
MILPEIDRHRIAWLTTEDHHGWATLTKIWFATDGRKLYTEIRRDSAACRQIRQRPQVRLTLGQGNARLPRQEISGQAYLLPGEESSWGRHLLARKYWVLRIPFLWSRRNVLLEITLT